jgi:hypothetical protein
MPGFRLERLMGGTDREIPSRTDHDPCNGLSKGSITAKRVGVKSENLELLLALTALPPYIRRHA